MSYRCRTCRGVVPAGQPRLVHLVKRPDGSIVRELAVCATCQEFLRRGTPAENIAASVPTAEVADPTPVPTKQQRTTGTKLIPGS